MNLWKEDLKICRERNRGYRELGLGLGLGLIKISRSGHSVEGRLHGSCHLLGISNMHGKLL